MMHSSSARFALALSVLWLAVALVYSAKREKTVYKADDLSTIYSVEIHGSEKAYQERAREPNKHLAQRLNRYFFFGGVLQRIAEVTKIPREEVVVDGPSEYQDQSSGRGTGIHAAHIIRVGAIDSRLPSKSPGLYHALANYLGHTQNVVKIANVWHGVGGYIDRYQSTNLSALATINFVGTYPENADSVIGLVDRFLAVIDTHVGEGIRNSTGHLVLSKAKIDLQLFNGPQLFLLGGIGYEKVKDGSFETHFDEPQPFGSSSEDT